MAHVGGGSDHRVLSSCFGDRKMKKRRLRLLTNSTEGGLYDRPRTKENMAAYEAMLGVIQQHLGGQPFNIVRAVADEILSLLQNPSKKDKNKLINLIPNNVFDRLVAIGKLITHFQDASSSVDHQYDDMGVTVQFEENEDDDLDMVQEEEEEEDEEDDDDLDHDVVGMLQMGGGTGGIDDHDSGMSLNVQDIDAYWLQRKISQHIIDPQQCHTLAEEILKILVEGDDKEVESKLVILFDYQNFSLIKFLLLDQLKIVWCTRLARAQDQQQRNKIEEEMLNLGPNLAAILEQLRATKANAKDREKYLENSIREEARRLKDESVNRDLQCQRQLLDLDSLAFVQPNNKFDLPMQHYRLHSKGYEEVHVPALKPHQLDPNEKLIKISEMPDWTHPAFKGMIQLNRVQSRVYETALYSPENILLCAPTGAGKTNVAVLTILQQLALNRNPDGTFNHSNYKIVYVAPMKALVAEVVSNLSNRLQLFYDVKVRELSGDQTLTRQQIEETQIIVTTPEKWDMITRKSGGDRTYTRLVKLVIIDEIHLLHDSRGPVLESIVARTVRQIETTKEHIRLVGLSATLPNFEDVALFLRVNLDKGRFHFDNSYRTVPLSQQYIGISLNKPLERFQLMNDLCYEKVMMAVAAGKHHQVLIFVHSRKETGKTARAIRDTALDKDTLGRFFKEENVISREILQSHTDLVKSNDLKDLLPYGFAIHHAGMTRGDRVLVQNLFTSGHVQVLVSTATLAWGVNLPAHTVIIKGTQIYNPDKGDWTEISPLDIMQMLGRAGRPQYDSHGEGIVITSHDQLGYYLSLMNHQLPIESQFVSKLADQLNAEIVLGTVQNAKEACNWIAYTYLYIRMLRNPALYGLPPEVLKEDVTLEERRADLFIFGGG